MKFVRRYNIDLCAWELGYYVSSRFYIVKVERDA